MHRVFLIGVRNLKGLDLNIHEPGQVEIHLHTYVRFYLQDV